MPATKQRPDLQVLEVLLSTQPVGYVAPTGDQIKEALESGASVNIVCFQGMYSFNCTEDTLDATCKKIAELHDKQIEHNKMIEGNA